ncbi:transcriptional regulator domain-containing protein [Bradyrhizobium paxllaeri]|uniref:transcriptional regulator domain-containing protein n=1 Tax=Bradyrhizobium paxllaeri TaxID=190148 RepID=UPI000810A51E|nr:DUF6499 domain-containing protein [Bradyrhizobium paxllaeri]
MPNFDWRSPEAYSKVQNVDLTGLAWECLRRNPEYRKHYSTLGNPLNAAPAEFRRKWGLTFRS